MALTASCYLAKGNLAALFVSLLKENSFFTLNFECDTQGKTSGYFGSVFSLLIECDAGT